MVAALVKVVLTGGPHAGKTTLANALRALGHVVLPEAGLAVIEDLRRRMGSAEAERWRQAHPEAFQAAITARQLEHERAADSADGVVILDRGLLDGVAYCIAHGTPVPAQLQESAGRVRYDLVFLLDTLQPFESRRDTGRMSDLDASLRLRELLREVYSARGFTPIDLPQMPLQERLATVSSYLA